MDVTAKSVNVGMRLCVAMLREKSVNVKIDVTGYKMFVVVVVFPCSFKLYMCTTTPPKAVLISKDQYFNRTFILISSRLVANEK